MTTLSKFDLTTLHNVAKETAVSAGQLIREKWDRPRQVSSKGYRDVVTDTDYAAQQLITTKIREQFPDHGFLTEETDTDLPDDGPVIWVIDPIDGTTNFSRYLPVLCVSIAAVSAAGELLSGAVYDPLRDELFSAAAGQGATMEARSRNGFSLQVSGVDNVAHAVLGVDWSYHQHLRQFAVQTLTLAAPAVDTVRAVGSAALALTWVAAGRLDGYIHYGLNAWDQAAASLLVQESGGQITMVDGSPWQYMVNGSGCVASNGRLHQQLLQFVSLPQ